MAELLDNLKKLRRQLIAEKGKLTVLATLQREDGGGFWDLLIAAPWAKHGDRSIFDSIAAQVRRNLSRQQFLDLSGIYILKSSSSVLRSILERFEVDNESVQVLVQEPLGDIPIRRGYILAAIKQPPRAARARAAARHAERRTSAAA